MYQTEPLHSQGAYSESDTARPCRYYSHVAMLQVKLPDTVALLVVRTGQVRSDLTLITYLTNPVYSRECTYIMNYNLIHNQPSTEVLEAFAN